MTTSAAPILELKGLCYDYADKKSRFTALDGIDLSVRKGEFVCVLGPSGCGKSTLLRILAGLNRATAGEARVRNQPVKGPGTDRAVVFQGYSLFPWLTAKGNVLFGMKQNGRRCTRRERNEAAMRYLRAVGLEEAADRYPKQLSGGMRQRVAVARALALESEILLMDEPFGAVDPRLRTELQELVSKLSSEEGKTVVFVTHDIHEAILLADRIVVMEPGHIASVVDVPFPHPRVLSDLSKTDEYERLRLLLTLAYYEKTGNLTGEGAGI